MPILLQKNISVAVSNPQTLLEQRLKEGRGRSFIHIVPTNRRVRDAERKYLRLLPYGTGERFRLFTLETLAVELFTLLCPPRRHIDGPSQAVLFHRAVQNIAPSLRYFRLHGGSRFLHRGTFQKIINVINNYKEEGVYPALLRVEFGDVSSDEKPKVHDLLAIYEEYERLLGTGYVDSAGYLKSVNEQWDADGSERVAHHFRDADLIVISGFDKFSDPEITLLSGLTDLRGFGTLIAFDYYSANEGVFGHLRENYKKFQEIGFKTAGSSHVTEDNIPARIAKYFFASDHPSPRHDCSTMVSVCSASGRSDEVELIAKIIKRLIHDQPDLSPGSICVAMFQPRLYTNLFREIFPAYGIPANITDRFPLDQSPPIIAILALLSVQERNFRFRDCIRALTTPYFTFGKGADAIDAGNLYEAGIALKISAGYTTWTERIDRRLDELQALLVSAEDDIEEWKLRREQENLRKAHRDLQHLAAPLAPFQHPLRPVEFREQVRLLFEKLHVIGNIMSDTARSLGDEQREKDARAVQKFFSFLDEYLDVLQSDEGGETAQPLAFYLDTLRTAIPHVRYNVRQKWGYGVLVTTMEETRGLEFEVMIIAGLVDGEFPPPYQPEVLLSRKRQDLTEHDHPLEHRYLFYQVATNFRKKLYLTMPQRDANRQLVPSSFIDALGGVIQFKDLRGKIPEELTDPVFSKSELLQHAGALIEFSGDASGDAINNLTSDEQLRATFDQMRLAVRVEKSRIGEEELPVYNGIISDALRPEASRALQSFRDKIFSVTQLESYGKCPFQFFADRVLRLKPEPEEEPGVSSRERGAVVHEILFEFYVERRRKNLPDLAHCTDREFTDAISDLHRIAASKLAQIGVGDIVWDLEKERLLGTTGRKGILNEFLAFERSRELSVRPSYFEVAFGSNVGGRKPTDPALNHPEPVKVREVLLRGKIDRVDLGDGMAKIIDYKTGNLDVKKGDIQAGISLQLPLYLYVIEEILADRMGEKYTPAAGVYYRLKSPVKEDIGIASDVSRGKGFEHKLRSSNIVPTDHELRRIIAGAVEFVNQYVDRIAQGKFPVAPSDTERVCKVCNFLTVCRIQNIAVVDRESSRSGLPSQ